MSKQTINANDNALSFISRAKRWGKQMGLDTDAIVKDMTSGDHEHLVEVFKEHFCFVCDVIEDDEDDEDDEYCYA